MNLLEIKLLFAFVALIVTCCCGLLPILLISNRNKFSLTSSRSVIIFENVMALATGVFLSMLFTGMIPNLRNTVLKINTDQPSHLPIAELLGIVNFLLFCILAELLRMYAARQNENQSVSSSMSQEEDNIVVKNIENVKLLNCHDTSMVNLSKEESLLHVVLLSFGLGVKTVLEGLAFGGISNRVALIHMGVSKVVHESICGGMLGIRFVTAMPQRCRAILAMMVYLLLMFLSMIVGIVVNFTFNQSPNAGGLIVSAILQTFALGATMYVVIMQMLPMASQQSVEQNAFRGRYSTLLRLGFIIVGFAFMSLLHLFHMVKNDHRMHNGTLIMD